MGRHTRWIALLTLLVVGPCVAAGREQTEQSSQGGREAAAKEPEHLIISGTVRRVLGSRVFILDDRLAADGELLVLAPDAEATPVAGTTVVAGGLFRQFHEAELENIRGWNEIDEHTREAFAGRPILVASSLSTAAGRPLLADASPIRTLRPSVRQPLLDTPREPEKIRLHPASLAELIDVVGGRHVTLPRARVLVVLNPRALLIESASSLSATIGNLDRLLVLVDAGALRGDAASLAGSNVRVLGVARTLLGIQVTREVPWPAELTPEVVKRYEIRAAVLATSVQTADGVELTDRRSPAGAGVR